MAEAHAGQIDTVMQEDRLFPPPADFAAAAIIGSLEEYQRMWDEAADDSEGFSGQSDTSSTRLSRGLLMR